MSKDSKREGMPGSGSGNVHSLIGKFQDSPARPAPTIPSHPSPSPSTSANPIQTPKQPPHNPDIDQTGLLALLGPSVSSFPYSEQAYIESIKLRGEQERTKQDFYKLELATKNLAILQTALRAQIPPNMIPQMCVGDTVPAPVPTLQPQSGHPPPLPANAPHVLKSPTSSENIPIPLNYHSRSSSRDLDVGPPTGYRFGGINHPTRRPNSPAKAGAAAVANLALPTTPYRSLTSNTRKSRHSRHYSMPASSSTRPLTRSDMAKPKNPAISPGTITPASSAPSPTPGTTSTLQVKPSPAQPLHKQNKSDQPPSQESMTSFQHIIQFHHWKPDGPSGPNIINNFRSQPQLQPPQSTHKRHKSENISIDVSPNHQNHQNQPNSIPGEKESNDTVAEDDMNMDSSIDDLGSNTSKLHPDDVDNDSNPPGPGHRRQSSNVGRYPHDILSPYSQ